MSNMSNMGDMREQIIEHLRTIFGSTNALDLFTSGIDDPKFDPDKPYRGRSHEMEDYLASGAGQMMLDLMSRNLELQQTYLDTRLVEDAYIIGRMTLSPAKQISSVTVA